MFRIIRTTTLQALRRSAAEADRFHDEAEQPYTDAPVCTGEAARAAGLDVAPAPSELTAMAELIVSTRGHEPIPEVDLARAVPLMAAEIDRLREESGDYAATCAQWEELFDQVAAERDELAARSNRAAVLREAADEVEGGQLGIHPELDADRLDGAERLRRMADAAERYDAGKAAPLIVDRFDIAQEPEPEDDPVLTIGAIARDGRPVALQLDPHDRVKVARWLVPDTGDSAGCVTAYGLPWLTWLDDDEQQEFLGEIASAALGYYREGDADADVLRDVVQACATYRLAAEADHAQATAPGTDVIDTALTRLTGRA
jgi:hypothetical protein